MLIKKCNAAASEQEAEHTPWRLHVWVVVIWVFLLIIEMFHEFYLNSMLYISRKVGLSPEGIFS